MIDLTHTSFETGGRCSRWMPQSGEPGRYAWPACAALARAFALRHKLGHKSGPGIVSRAGRETPDV